MRLQALSQVFSFVVLLFQITELPMRTIAKILKKTKVRRNLTPQKSNGNFSDIAPVLFTFFIILLISFQAQAQRFWLTTYEFPFGPKTGITLTNNNCLFVGIENGVIKSCDEGNHFEIALESSAVFTVFSTKEGKVLAGGLGKIFITDYSAQNWDSIPINSEYPVIQFIENSKGDLFAITSAYSDSLQDFAGDGVFFSGDYGLTWTTRNNGLGNYTSCEKIAIDKNDRLYVASADNDISGNGGLFISDDNGMVWKHIDVTIDGRNAINDQLQVGNTFGLSVSPHDSLNFSFTGSAINTSVEINLRKSINDIEKNNFWETYQVSNSNLWWDDTDLFDIHYAKNGDWYSSIRGTVNSGATYYSKNGSGHWVKVDYGLGLNIFGMRDAQFFAENPDGKIFMVQWLDERVYWTDASILTSVDPVPGALKKLKLYPNPVKAGESFSIQWNANEASYIINIYDGVGRKLFSAVASGNVNRLKAPMNPGIYYLKVEDKQTCETHRFVVE